MDVGLHLRQIRKSYGLSVDFVAGCLGVDASTIVRYENGTIDMPFSVLCAYCSAINISLAELFASNGDPDSIRITRLIQRLTPAQKRLFSEVLENIVGEDYL